MEYGLLFELKKVTFGCLMCIFWGENDSTVVSNMSNIDQFLNSQKSPHSSPSWVNYKVSIVKTLENNDHIMARLYCSQLWEKS